MRLALVTPPSIEPVSLAEAKLYLRVGSTAEDSEISAMIAASRSLCEKEVARSFITTTWDLFLDSSPEWDAGLFRQVIRIPLYSDVLKFPRGDLIAVSSVTYTDTTGTTQTLDPSLYKVSPGSPGRISPAYGRTWPSIASQMDAMQIRFTAGYGPTAADVPDVVKSAIKITLAHIYENRGEQNAQIPDTARLLLSTVQWGDYA